MQIGHWDLKGDKNTVTIWSFPPSDRFPSGVSGQGYKFGLVWVSVCLSVSQRSCGWTVWATDLKFGVIFV